MVSCYGFNNIFLSWIFLKKKVINFKTKIDSIVLYPISNDLLLNNNIMTINNAEIFAKSLNIKYYDKQDFCENKYDDDDKVLLLLVNEQKNGISIPLNQIIAKTQHHDNNNNLVNKPAFGFFLNNNRKYEFKKEICSSTSSFNILLKEYLLKQDQLSFNLETNKFYYYNI